MRTMPPLRILLAIAITVLALGALVVAAVVGDDGGEDASRPDDDEEQTTTTIAPATTSADVGGTSVVVAPDWYPKGTSRYSDRTPAVTITTLPPTSAPEPDEDEDVTGDEAGDDGFGVRRG